MYSGRELVRGNMKPLKINLNGKLVENYRNDLHNTFSPKNHKPHFVPSYKNLFKNQLATNKGLLIANGLLALTTVGIIVGCNIRTNGKQAKIEALQHELERTMEIAESNVIEYNKLESELASCSAKLQEKKLSAKAKAHVKQQPIVAEKIKEVFGDEWAEATELYSRESSLNPLAVNDNGGACGLWQAYPCSKLTVKCALSDVDCQLQTGKEYIQNRYGSVTKALAFHDVKGYY